MKVSLRAAKQQFQSYQRQQQKQAISQSKQQELSRTTPLQD
jgi:hypothetical protein